MANKIHKVRNGECLATVAKKYGFVDWRSIYDHPDNAELRKKRPNPNLIYTGDKIVIPEKQTKEDAGNTETRHRFKRLSSQTQLRIVVRDEDGNLLSDIPYKLVVKDQVFERTTDQEGLLEEEIPADVEHGELTIFPDEESPEWTYTWRLMIGHLDPLDTISGVQGRLNNLGFDCGKVDGKIGPRTKGAIEAFQAEHELSVDGKPGPETQEKLKEIHGC